MEESFRFVMPGPSLSRFFSTRKGGKALAAVQEAGDRISVFGAGKASKEFALSMARFTADGVSCEVNGPASYRGGDVSVLKCSHPLPDVATVRNSLHILNSSMQTGTDELIIFLLSGGASSMFSVPHEDTSLDEKREVTRALMKKGATISELNCVRRHLSAVKGGRYAASLFPRRIFAFEISDVPTGKLQDIGSGPTCPDPTNCSDALRILVKFNLKGNLSARTVRALENGSLESVKAGDRRIGLSGNHVIADNRDAVDCFADSSRRRGINSVISERTVSSEPAEAARLLIAEGRRRVKGRGVLVAGGETVLAVPATSSGGRCQHFALAGSRYLRKEELLIAVGTDGKDGNSRFAGGIGCSDYGNAADYVDSFESGRFFSEKGSGILTGRTGTNVSDIYLYCRL